MVTVALYLRQVVNGVPVVCYYVALVAEMQVLCVVLCGVVSSSGSGACEGGVGLRIGLEDVVAGGGFAVGDGLAGSGGAFGHVYGEVPMLTRLSVGLYLLPTCARAGVRGDRSGGQSRSVGGCSSSVLCGVMSSSPAGSSPSVSTVIGRGGFGGDGGSWLWSPSCFISSSGGCNIASEMPSGDLECGERDRLGGGAGGAGG